MTPTIETLLDEIEPLFTKAYNSGVAAGMLNDKAAHCYHEETKAGYEERMHFFQEEFKATHILALKKMDALRAAVEAVKVDAWQDISTAPVCVASEGSNNGRKPVLVTRWPVTGRHHPVAVARLTRNGWMSGKRGTSLWFEPTHWMPLPKPPGDTA